MKTKLPYQYALTLAQSVIERLDTACQRIEIAGSLRRKKQEVGDIEIVAIPDWIIQTSTDLFGNTTERRVSVLETPALYDGWKRIKGGEHYKQFDLGPCCLDLFITTPEQWGVIFTIRTGSAEFSRRLVTHKQHGGYMPAWLSVKDGRLRHGKQVIDTPEERDFFHAIGLKWFEPQYR